MLEGPFKRCPFPRNNDNSTRGFGKYETTMEVPKIMMSQEAYIKKQLPKIVMSSKL
jgi:hypothetical protein